MDELHYNLECLAYEEKLKLSELEAQKAQERTAEIAYEYARFRMQWLVQMTKLAQQQTGTVTPPPPAPKS